MNRLLSLALIALILIAPVRAATGPYPAHVFTRNVDQGTVLLVEKASRRAWLIDLGDPPQIRRQFEGLMLGENGGRKYRVGDRKTPEGIYHVLRYLPDEVLDARYGSGAFPLDYPNPIDRFKGRNGSGIWLHGRDDNDKDKQATLGCVAFANEDIRTLRDIIHPDTPVVITDRLDFVDAATYEKERKRLLGVLDRFLEAWERGHFDQLEHMLDPAFHGVGGLDKRNWLARKQNIFHHQQQRVIEAEQIVALRENHEQVVFDFVQTYCASTINSRGRKRLFFQKSGDRLRLLSEQYSPLPPASIPKERVERFVQGWLADWNLRDLDVYMARYARDFRDSKGRDLAAFKAFKQSVFARRPRQHITIDDMQIQRLGPNRFRVSFIQHYRSRELSDTGYKTLLISGCGQRLWIEQETWKPL